MQKTKVLGRILLDFLIGGGLVAIALAVGFLFSPLVAGVIAALPIRVGATIFLGGVHEGAEFAHKMVEGGLLTYAGTLGFFLVLYYAIPRFGLLKSFGGAVVVALAITLVAFKLAGKF